MGRPREFDLVWDLRLTRKMAAAIRMASTAKAVSRQEWIRTAIAEKLARDAKKRRAA
jgi:ABC-type cobalamin transport system permease subunit